MPGAIGTRGEKETSRPRIAATSFMAVRQPGMEAAMFENRQHKTDIQEQHMLSSCAQIRPLMLCCKYPCHKYACGSTMTWSRPLHTSSSRTQPVKWWITGTAM